MARTPAKTSKSSVPTRADKIRKLLRKGWTSSEIAERLAPEDKRKQKIIRTQVRNIAASDQEFIAMKGLASKGVMIENLEEVTEAVVRRGKRGRVDAAKLMYAATGFHSDRVKHEHSGDVKITLNLPRPERVQIPADVDSTAVED